MRLFLTMYLETNIYAKIDKIYMNKPISRSELNYYTKPLGKYVKEIYGFQISI